jgi:hypothetical protein
MKHRLDVVPREATARKPRSPRIAALLNAAATLATAIAAVGTGGPKLPPASGD